MLVSQHSIKVIDKINTMEKLQWQKNSSTSPPGCLAKLISPVKHEQKILQLPGCTSQLSKRPMGDDEDLPTTIFGNRLLKEKYLFNKMNNNNNNNLCWNQLCRSQKIKLKEIKEMEKRHKWQCR
jgi:hypothetical protein